MSDPGPVAVVRRQERVGGPSHQLPGYGGVVGQRTEQAALVALLLGRRTGWASVTDKIETQGSALPLLEAESAPDQPLLPGTEVDRSIESRLDDAERAIGTWLDQGLNLTTVLDEDYPSQLRAIHQRPPVLFYRGRIDEQDADGVAVVGTRHPSDLGAAQATAVASGLAGRGVTVISGLAAGIDTAAHLAALQAGGRTVAVLGTGLLQHYPRENAALQERIATDHLVFSQFWPDAPPSKKSFPMRNAVMSGYAAATVVIEASYRSGARMQARLALEHGRPVLLMRTLLEHDWARSYAERPGTYVVENSDQILQLLQDVLVTPPSLVWA